MTTILLCIVGGYAAILAMSFVGARKMFRQMSTAWDTPHEYRPVESIPGVPAQGYERVQAELARLGFHRVARAENLAMTKAYPQLRTFLDSYASESGEVYSATYWVLTPPSGQQVVDFESAFEDHTFLITTNGTSVALLGPPPKIDRQVLKGEEDSEKLLQAHRQRLGELLVSGGKALRPIRSFADLDQAQRVQSQHECQYRRSIGYLTYEEVRAMGRGQILLPGSLRFLYWIFRKHVEKHRSAERGS